MNGPTSADPGASSIVSRAAAFGVAVVAAVVLAGWVFDIPEMKSAYGTITMKTNAAIGLLLGAFALWSQAGRFRRAGLICAAGAAVIGALTLLEHVTGWNFGIDQLLFSEPAGAIATVSPNRMGPNASLSLVMAGVALICLFRATARTIRWAQWLAIAGLVLALLALAGYMYGAVELYAVARYTGIALHTAAALMALQIGILTARVDAGPMAVFVADAPAGLLLRRLAVPVVVAPLALGYVVIRGREAALYDRGLAIAIFAVSVIVILSSVVWHTANVIAVSDISRRRAEEDRDQLLVRERHARDEAERASRLKDQFIAVLSHELRTPLNVMLGWAQVLESDTSPERHARAAAIVARNGRMLARLVEDLLDVSRVSAGQFEISRQSTAFNPIVQSAVDALTPAARAKGVTVSFEADGRIDVIDADPERLQQVVSNLLSNAIKFTPEGGRIDVSTALDSAQAVLTVTDNGIGFDATFAAELFQPFRQADSSFKRAYGGLGLGLSIAKHIVDLHGGSIEGTSAGPGRGATFTLRLPAQPTDAQRPGDVAPQPESNALPTSRV